MKQFRLAEKRLAMRGATSSSIAVIERERNKVARLLKTAARRRRKNPHPKRSRGLALKKFPKRVGSQRSRYATRGGKWAHGAPVFRLGTGVASRKGRTLWPPAFRMPGGRAIVRGLSRLHERLRRRKKNPRKRGLQRLGASARKWRRRTRTHAYSPLRSGGGRKGRVSRRGVVLRKPRRRTKKRGKR